MEPCSQGSTYLDMCIISNKHEFLFFHNPKCGGSSVRHAVENYCDIKSIKWFKDRDVVNHKYWYHEPASCVRSHFAKWAKHDYFAFGLIRNPWDRMVSWWSFCGWDKEYLPKGVKKVDEKYEVLDLAHVDNTHLLDRPSVVKFDEFVELCHFLMVESKHKFTYNKSSVDNVYWQGEELIHEDNFWPCRLIYPSLAHNFFTDYKDNYCVKVFKLEYINDMVEYVYKRTGIKMQLGHINRSSRDANYSRYYNDKTKKMVEEIYYSDVELGQYQF